MPYSSLPYLSPILSVCFSSLPHYTPTTTFFFLFLLSSHTSLCPSPLPCHAPPAPSASPNEVEATPLSSNLMSLSWVPPDLIGQNGLITNYDVLYSGGGSSNITHAVGVSTTYILAGLQPYTTYSIRVAAKNSQGRGPFSTSIEQATLEAGETACVNESASSCINMRFQFGSNVICKKIDDITSNSIFASQCLLHDWSMTGA